MFGIKKSSPSTGSIEYIIAGLGNPGKDYEKTRHNTGFMAISKLAEDVGVEIKKSNFKSLCADTRIKGCRCLLMMPQTFMNNSGEAIRDAVNFYKVPMDHVIILYDDISLDPGKLRVRPKGSAGGHNGIKSIINLNGTEVFPRVKIGVGAKPHPDYDLADWVLGKPKKEDAELITGSLDKATLAVETIIGEGIAKAMNDFN